MQLMRCILSICAALRGGEAAQYIMLVTVSMRPIMRTAPSHAPPPSGSSSLGMAAAVWAWATGNA